jgi:hypothetical protein
MSSAVHSRDVSLEEPETPWNSHSHPMRRFAARLAFVLLPVGHTSAGAQ